MPPVTADLIHGFAGAFWFAGLWYAAPALSPRKPSAVARVAAIGALGVALPFALGLVGLLYPLALWLGLLAVAVIRVRRHGFFTQPDRDGPRAWDLGLLVCVLVAIAWPVVVRPLMDGDSLGYHLPNAASWVVHHGIWTTGTRYWWYPGGSELFASGLFAVSGPAIVGLAGLVPALLIGLRLRAIAVANGNHPVLGTGVACASLATSVVSQQLVSLQNDLWLAAYFLEALTAFAAMPVALAALVKPYGVLLASVASAIRWTDVRKKPSLWLASFAPLAIWAARDLVLYGSAIVPPASTWFPDTASTSIAAHFPGSLELLASATWSAGVAWAALSTSALAAIVFARDAWLRWAALAALALFLVVPFGYNNDYAQLSNGQSLRYSLPFVLMGAAALCTLRSRFALVLIPLASLSVAFEIGAVWNVYWNDALTHDVLYALAFAAVVSVAAMTVRSTVARAAVATAAFAFVCTWTAGLAGARPTAYLADRYGANGVRAGAFEAFRTTTSARIVAVKLPAGAAILVRPDVDAYDAEPFEACARARALHAPLLIGLPVGASALACGRIVFKDASSALVAP